MLINLDIPPGIDANGTEYETGTRGRWRRGNLVRWSEGLLRPVGGWQAASSANNYEGTARSLFAWRSLDAARWLAIGTETNLYAWSETFGLLDITPNNYVTGRGDAIDGLGYGALKYGESEYGTPREGVGGGMQVLDASQWSFDAWGQNLIGVAVQDTRILEWTPVQNPANLEPAEPVDNAPTCRSAFVTAERVLVALGADGDPKKVQWSASENNTEWVPSATNFAGDIRLQTEGALLRGVRYRGSNLLFTSADLHRMDFIGPPLVYSFETVGRACGPASAQSIIVTESIVVWMGERQFYVYDGIVRPLPCEVEDAVFGAFDVTQKSKVVAGHLPNFNEIWWFYPATALGGMRYVTWNYKENTWSLGDLHREAILSPGVFDQPIMATRGNPVLFVGGGSGPEQFVAGAPPGVEARVYFHEQGWTANGAPIGSGRWVESGAFSISPEMAEGNGDTVLNVRQMVPDERTSGQTRVRFKTRFYPNGPESEFGPYSLSKLTDMRFQARQVSMRVEGVADADWRIGLPRFDVHPGGRR